VGYQVSCCGAQDRRVVFDAAKQEVATGAEQGANLAGDVIMVDVGVLSVVEWFATYGAQASLSLKHRLFVGQCKVAVVGLQVPLAAAIPVLRPCVILTLLLAAARLDIGPGTVRTFILAAALLVLRPCIVLACVLAFYFGIFVSHHNLLGVVTPT
jgi:hypothetical protein